LKNDLEFINECLELNANIFKYVSDELKKNRELCLRAIKISQDGYNFQHCENIDIKDRDFIIESVSLAGFTLYYMDDNVRDDFEIAKIAVYQDGKIFKYLSERLRNNKELLIDSVKQSQNFSPLENASSELKSDEKLILQLLDYVKSRQYILNYTAENIKSNKEIVLKAVKINGWNLQYASEELKNDKEVVFEAVSEYSSSIEYASERIVNDLDFYEILTQIQGIDIRGLNYNILYFFENKRLSRNLIIKMLEKNVETFERLDDEYKSDEEIIYLALRRPSKASNIVKHIVTNNNSFLEYLIFLNKQNPLGNYKTELLTSKERLLMAMHVYYVPSYPGLFRSIPDELKNDPDVQSLIIEKSK
jgi:hypothetical protein